MKFLKISKIFKVFADLKFALVILFFIAITSSIGSIIEQDQPLNFYQINYSLDKPIYGFLNWKVILFFGFIKSFLSFKSFLISTKGQEEVD